MVRFETINPEGRTTFSPFVYSSAIALERLRKFKLKERKGTVTVMALTKPGYPITALWLTGYSKLNTQELSYLIRLIEAKWKQQERREECFQKED